MNRDGYTISTDNRRLDVGAIHSFLTQSYWSPGIPLHVVETAVANSLCFGLFHGVDQVGFARVVSDKATFAYLADVYVLEAHRRRGLAKWLLEVVLSQAELQGLRRILLATRDAHELYKLFGFTELSNPSRMMEIFVADAYSVR